MIPFDFQPPRPDPPRFFPTSSSPRPPLYWRILDPESRRSRRCCIPLPPSLFLSGLRQNNSTPRRSDVLLLADSSQPFRVANSRGLRRRASSRLPLPTSTFNLLRSECMTSRYIQYPALCGPQVYLRGTSEYIVIIVTDYISQVWMAYYFVTEKRLLMIKITLFKLLQFHQHYIPIVIFWSFLIYIVRATIFFSRKVAFALIFFFNIFCE